MCLFARSVHPDSGLTTGMWPTVFQSTEVLKDSEFLTGNSDDLPFTRSLFCGFKGSLESSLDMWRHEGWVLFMGDKLLVVDTLHLNQM